MECGQTFGGPPRTIIGTQMPSHMGIQYLAFEYLIATILLNPSATVV